MRYNNTTPGHMAISVTLAILLAGLIIPHAHPSVLKHGARVLARVTFYYPREGGSGSRASTGARLRPWHSCAVDPRIIPYGSEIMIPGIGTLLAHDTGTAVISRKAARGYRFHLIVIDVCVRNALEMDRMSHAFPDVVEIRRL